MSLAVYEDGTPVDEVRECFAIARQSAGVACQAFRHAIALGVIRTTNRVLNSLPTAWVLAGSGWGATATLILAVWR